MDIDTIIPSMLLNAGGNAFLLGTLISILGYNITFIMVSLLVLTGSVFIGKLKCR